MTKQITLEKALKLVEFAKTTSGEWQIKNIYGDVYGDVWGDVHGDETPKEKLPAADWQLEQVIEWLRFIAQYGRYNLDFHNDTNSFLNDLRKVMRPTQENDQ
jgi:hypothetical protein